MSSADEFYSVMGVVTREMLEFGLMDPNTLVKVNLIMNQLLRLRAEVVVVVAIQL